ncbi:MAG: regulatory protein RecX [Flavobacteriales bacterium]|jgi:regulatory protein|nr:regulatory protein RecX [Flavobacteriales bacterium]
MDSSPSEALQKMQKYCAYQERSHKDVNQKMWDLKIPMELRDDILLNLIQQNFLNEERFARAYVRGKFKIKKWGRNKIIKGLKQHQVQKKCIQLALQEIDEELYLQILKEVLTQKSDRLKEKNAWKRRGSLYRFATQRGFESAFVNEAINEL